MLDKLVVGEPDADENDRKHDEAHHLNGFTAPSVDESNGDPISRDRSSTDNDKISNGGVVKGFIHGISLGVTDGTQDDRVIETKTIKGNIKGEPRARCPEQNFAVLPLAIVAEEVRPASLGNLETGD